jgi:hypothetical protein
MFAAALSQPTGCAVPPEQVEVIGDCTAPEFMGRLQAAAASTGPEDLLVVYFAGHGFSDESEFYLCFKGAARASREETCVSGRALDKVLSAPAARGIFVILDCCQSAGFAENAPQFVRVLREGQFRLLLSASRAGNPSWELPDGKGTLFTHHLLRAIRGEERISETPGFIYFSELLSYVQQQVARDLETLYPQVPRQEPVFAGIFAQDPLLFVHHSLTLEQIKVRTDRYTRTHLVRAIRNTVAGLAAALSFFVGTWYTALDHRTYLTMEPRGVVLYRGDPAYNAFGFPKVVWIFPIQDYMIRDDDRLRRAQPLTGALGSNAAAQLATHLKPEFAVAQLFNQGQMEEARRVLEMLVEASGQIRSVFPGVVAGEWADIAATRDIERLRGMASRSDLQPFVVAQVYRGLLRLDADDLLRDPSLNPERIVEDDAIQSTVLENLRGPCSAAMATYFSRLFRSPEHRALRLKVLDSALRVGFRASPEDVAAFLRNSNVREEHQAIGRYLALAGISDPLAILAPLIAGADEWMRDRAFTALIASEASTPCQPGWRRFVSPGTVRVHPATVHALLTYCPQFALADTVRAQPGSAYLLVRALHGMLDPDELSTKAEINNRLPDYMYLFGAIRVAYTARPAVFEPARAQITSALVLHASFNEGLVRAEALSLLDLIKADVSTAARYYNDSTVNVREAAYRWSLRERPGAAIGSMLDRIGEPTSDYLIGLLGAAPLTETDLGRLRRALDGSDEARARASAILALSGSPAEVAALFRHPDWRVRRAASDYFVANPQRAEIAKRVSSFVSPAGEIVHAEEQAKKTAALLDEVSGFGAPMRRWRARLVLSGRPLNAGERILLENIAGTELASF